MLKDTIKNGNTSMTLLVIKTHDANGFNNLLKDEDLSMLELNCLRNLLNTSGELYKNFVEITQEFIDKKIRIINKEILI